jgi:hypothetical protein
MGQTTSPLIIKAGSQMPPPRAVRCKTKDPREFAALVDPEIYPAITGDSNRSQPSGMPAASNVAACAATTGRLK